MLIGARTAAWGGYTARDYVQSGLIAMWDGIENAGWGTHDANATMWKDLIGSNDISLSNCAITSQSVDANGSSSVGLFSSSVGNITTLELCLFDNYAYTYGSNCYNGTYYALIMAGTSSDPCVGISSNNTSTSGGAYYLRPDNNDKAYSAMYDNDKVRTLSIQYGSSFVSPALKINNVSQTTLSLGCWDAYGSFRIFNRNGKNNFWRGKLFNTRFYNRVLTAAEIAANYAIDKARFNLT